MDGRQVPAGPDAGERDLIRSASAQATAPGAIDGIKARLGSGPFALVSFFVSPEVDFAEVMASAWSAFPGTQVTGCTTAGEICEHGYAEGMIVAVALCESHFRVETAIVEGLSDLDADATIGDLIRLRAALARSVPEWDQEFVFLTVDGMSRREDVLTAALAAGLGPVPLFGGSAGDGTKFGRTYVAQGARVHQDAAVLAFVRTRCPIKVFSLDNLHPTNVRMVVTEADPDARIVRRINAEPAAREYARILGKDPELLDPFIFAAHPVVVRFGGEHHVRAIQQVAANGDLVFFSAIGEGLVLTLAEAEDIASHLGRELEAMGQPEAILACDCILRRIEAQQSQRIREVSELLSRHRVVGFGTYGEQLNAMHVNQTMTGVAIYAPKSP